jgi:NADH-quinone oxidoreductase subunit J
VEAVVYTCLVLMLVFGIMAVMQRSMIKSAIALAAASVSLGVIMYELGAVWAALFEISVCSGLVTVIFISAINMTRIRTKEELEEKKRERHKRFVFLPAILIIALAVTLVILWPHIDSAIPPLLTGSGATVQDILWGKRQADLMGQVIIILAGVYGVIIFFKERDPK